MIRKEEMHDRAPVLLEFYEGINSLINFEADKCRRRAKFARVGSINKARRENPATDIVFFKHNEKLGAIDWKNQGGEEFLKGMYPALNKSN